MITLLPPTAVFYEDMCDTCKEPTTHRISDYEYDKKKHKISCMITCTECERIGTLTGKKFPAYFVKFDKQNWLNMMSYLGLIEPEN